MSNYFLDTSAILNGALKEYLSKNIYGPDNVCYISPLTLQELENIKTSAIKNEDVKYHAREAARTILYADGVQVITCNQRKVNRLLHKYNFLNDINDHRLICECKLSGISDIIFITSDVAQYILAQRVVKAEYYQAASKGSTEYCGWQKYHPNDEEMTELYSNPSNNILGALTNQFVEIYEENHLKDILQWDGECYQRLKYNSFKGQLGEKVAPRNLEQKMLFHLLQENDTKIKLCLGGFGDGKTWTMLQHALKGVNEGRFSKIVFVRNNIITKGSRDIGFLSGSMVEKIYPYLMPIADLTSPETLNMLIDNGTLEPVPLGFLRGRDFSNSTLIFCDEAENLTKENVQLLIGRVGEGSQLWMAGDLKQIDHKDFEQNNGITKMISSLKGDPLFGMVKLIKSERSTTASLADKMDN